MTEKNEQCLNCKYAAWDKTDSGRLHPSGGGLCVYEPKMLDVQASK